MLIAGGESNGKPDTSQYTQTGDRGMEQVERRASRYTSKLRGANLAHKDLSLADFSRTDLKRADFAWTKLFGASFIRSDLRWVNFTWSDIRMANFTRASLNGANLSQAHMAFTILGDADLSEVKGLDTVKHVGPSDIGINTIYRSKGNISELFLRKAGVPEEFIAYMRSLIAHPIEYYTYFISYSSLDRNFTEFLYNDLQREGVRCWFAPEDLKIGEYYTQRIDESIRLYDKLILILSESAIQSSWVEREVLAAREKEDREQRPVLFPIRLDDTVMTTTKAWTADVRRRWHIGDFTMWKYHDSYQVAFKRLLHDLKTDFYNEGIGKQEKLYDGPATA